ncbi:unnamed protein product, partial [Brenthis ino]
MRCITLVSWLEWTMASWPETRGIHDSEIVRCLEQSELDLTDEEDPVPIPIFQNEEKISSGSGSSNSEDETRPGSEIFLASSTTATTRCRARTRGEPRTLGGRSRGSRLRTRGTQNDRSSLVNNRRNCNFSPVDRPIFQPTYKSIDTDIGLDLD